jgi:hypothetical protein
MPDSKSTPATGQVVTNASGLVSEPRPKKLLDQIRDAIRRKHYSPRAEECHVHWIKRFIQSQLRFRRRSFAHDWLMKMN